MSLKEYIKTGTNKLLVYEEFAKIAKNKKRIKTLLFWKKYLEEHEFDDMSMGEYILTVPEEMLRNLLLFALKEEKKDGNNNSRKRREL